jgi:serine/threonine protein kinase
LNRAVALKVLLPQHLHSTVVLARFLQEARTAASLAHPNIVQIYLIEEKGPWPYFVMEFIAGQSLEALTRARPFSIATAVQVLTAVAEAVHYAHSRGIIHRDLKPANIMVDQFHRPVIMDFGIARAMGQAARLTQQGAIIGTPAYMAPEQATDDLGEVGPQSDVYSLGAVLYTLLTGKPPFDEGTILRTLMKVVSSDQPVAVRTVRSEVPPALEAICMKCMSKRVGDRYRDARGLAEALRRFRGKTAKSPKKSRKAASITLLAKSNGKEYSVSEGVSVIGRASDCKFVLKVSEVSKHHCRIEVAGSTVTVEDLGSVNGTFVNGLRTERAPLRDGDELRIAERHIFTVRIAEQGE